MKSKFSEIMSLDFVINYFFIKKLLNKNKFKKK